MGTRAAALIVAGAIAAAMVSTPSTAVDLERAGLETAAHIESGGLLMYAPAAFASAHGGRMSADFISGVFAQSAGRIHLLSYDRVSKSFRQDMVFETAAIPGVALVPGPYGRSQLQIQTESGLVACNFGKFLDRAQIAAKVYDRLIAAGARTFTSPGWIEPVMIPGPVIITVYIPAH